MSSRLDDLHTDVREKCRALLRDAEARGMRVVLVHTLRTFDEQERLYAKGRSPVVPGEPCIHERKMRAVGTCPEHPHGATVTNARGGFSWHNFGRAFDLAFVDEHGRPTWNRGPEEWEALGELGEVHGLRWGGRWRRRPDFGHFEHNGGQSLAQARSAYMEEQRLA